VVGKTKTAANQVVQRLHALGIADGAELAGWPITISASVPGSNELGASTISFNPATQNQRAALVLWRPPSGDSGNSVVFIAWGSYADAPPYHGWLIGYDTVTGSQVAAFSTTPNIQELAVKGTHAGGGSIWQAGQGPAVDDAGNLYFMTGNGLFDENKHDFGESFVKLSFSVAGGISVADFFTPNQWEHFNYWDVDLGSAGVLLIPGSNFLVGGGKDGWLYPIDRTNMGHLEPHQYSMGLNATGNHIGLRHIHGSPVTWVAGTQGRLIYVWGENDVLRAFKFDTVSGLLGPGTYAEGDIDTGCGSLAIECMPGGMLTVSASGTSVLSGIIWASLPDKKDAIHQVAPGRLIAFQASPVQGKILELWRSDKSPGNASASNRTDVPAAYKFSKFAPPTVVNGKVYLATFSNELRVYGLK
jgi:hypothetical protein